MSGELLVVRHSGLINIREVNGQPVHLYADIAEALQVDSDRVRRAYARNAEGWNPGETGVCHFDSPSGIQESRWFSHRGAMRFCRFIKSGRADVLFNHLLDLWESHRGNAQGQVADERIAVYLDQIVPAVAGRINEISARVETHSERLAAVEERQAITDPREIERRMFTLHRLKKHLVDGTKEAPDAVTYSGFWSALKERLKIASFQNRGALTVPQLDEAIKYAQSWCFARGVEPPSLFDQTSGVAT